MTWPTEETENGKCCLLGTALCYAVNYYIFAVLAQKMDHSCGFRRMSLAQLLNSEKGKTLAAVLPKKIIKAQHDVSLKIHTEVTHAMQFQMSEHVKKNTPKHKIQIKQLN